MCSRSLAASSCSRGAIEQHGGGLVASPPASHILKWQSAAARTSAVQGFRRRALDDRTTCGPAVRCSTNLSGRHPRRLKLIDRELALQCFDTAIPRHRTTNANHLRARGRDGAPAARQVLGIREDQLEPLVVIENRQGVYPDTLC